MHIEFVPDNYPLGILHTTIERYILPLQASIHEMLFTPACVHVQVVDDAGELTPLGFFGHLRIAREEGTLPCAWPTKKKNVRGSNLLLARRKRGQNKSAHSPI